MLLSLYLDSALVVRAVWFSSNSSFLDSRVRFRRRFFFFRSRPNRALSPCFSDTIPSFANISPRQSWVALNQGDPSAICSHPRFRLAARGSDFIPPRRPRCQLSTAHLYGQKCSSQPAKGFALGLQILHVVCWMPDGLVVQDHAQEATVDRQPVVIGVIDKAQLPELVHEMTDPRPGCADHFCQVILTHSGKH